MVLIFGSVVVGLILPVHAQGEYVAFPESVSVSSSDLVPHDLILKAILKQDGDVEKVSGFKLDPINVISVLEGGTISATSTDEVIVFEQAKAKSSTDSLFELQKTTTQGQQEKGGFSLAGLAPGVYTLDMIATKNNAKSAYEGILVIGQNAESQEVKQTVEREIIEVERDTPTTIIPIFQPPSNPQPPIILQQQQQQPNSPQALAAQQTPSPAPVAPSDAPPDGTPCTGVDNVDIGVYKNGKCTPETLPPDPSPPATAAGASRGIIPSCILTADCPPSLLPPSPPPSTSSNAESDNGNEPDPCLLDPSLPGCQVTDTFDPLAAEAGQTGEGGEDGETGEDGTENTDEIARESDDTDEEDSESGSESDGGSDGDGGDGGDGGSDGGGEDE